MRVISKTTVAVAVTLATVIVCFFGIRAELSQAEQQSAKARAHETSPKADATPSLALDAGPEKQ